MDSWRKRTITELYLLPLHSADTLEVKEDSLRQTQSEKIVITVRDNPARTWTGQETQSLTEIFDIVGEMKYPSYLAAAAPTEAVSRPYYSENPEKVHCRKSEAVVEIIRINDQMIEDSEELCAFFKSDVKSSNFSSPTA